MVGRQPEFARQRLDGARVHAPIRTPQGGQPRPHHAPTIWGQYAFGGKKVDAPLLHAKQALFVAAPVEPAVCLWYELLVCSIPITDVVAAPNVVTNAQEHPFVADAEKVGARNVFAICHIGQVVCQKVAHQRPAA